MRPPIILTCRAGELLYMVFPRVPSEVPLDLSKHPILRKQAA